MNLRDRLREIDSKPKVPAQPVASRVFTDCRHSCVTYPAEAFPGAEFLRGEALRLMLGDEFPAETDPHRILYMDTETTGLAGTGTVAFLVGLGYLTDTGFEVHQFLMRDYPEEPFLLKHLDAGFRRFDLLCTFNGKSFDVPLLHTRFLMNRMDPGCLELPHIDLLHLSRRLWKLRLKQCNLGRLEELILGTRRQDDLPGAEVPQRYFDYLKTGQFSLLEDVLKHNAQDIASLCVLLNRMAELYLNPEQISYGEDLFSMGRALEKTRHNTEARKCYRLAMTGRMSGHAGTALARSYRRAGDSSQAAAVWQQMIDTQRGGIAPYVELAKYREHVLKDIPGALELTRRALVLLAEPGLHEADTVQKEKNELQYRYTRLKRKAQKE